MASRRVGIQVQQMHNWRFRHGLRHPVHFCGSFLYANNFLSPQIPSVGEGIWGDRNLCDRKLLAYTKLKIQLQHNPQLKILREAMGNGRSFSPVLMGIPINGQIDHFIVSRTAAGNKLSLCQTLCFGPYRSRAP